MNQLAADLDRKLASSRKKTVLYLGMCAAAGLVLLAFSGCASATRTSKNVACQTTPQWYTNDAQGHPTAAVFVCFGDNNALLWQSRPLTFDEILKLITPAAPPPFMPPAPTPVPFHGETKVEIHQVDANAKTETPPAPRVLPSEAPAARVEAPKTTETPAPLPTLGGTAAVAADQPKPAK